MRNLFLLIISGAMCVGLVQAFQDKQVADNEVVATSGLTHEGFKLMTLPYEYDALEPYIDAKTVEIHYSKHHQGYVNNLNDLLKDYPQLVAKGLDYILTHLDEVPEDIRQKVINNGGGVYNHNFYWNIMTPKIEDKVMNASLEKLLRETFGSLEAFKTQFEAAATGQFGSGWAWLVVNAAGDLEIMTTSNQDTPITLGLTPILGIDVWEHAYYLKYQNLRAEYVKNFWNVVNWAEVERLYELAPKAK